MILYHHLPFPFLCLEWSSGLTKEICSCQPPQFCTFRRDLDWIRTETAKCTLTWYGEVHERLLLDTFPYLADPRKIIRRRPGTQTIHDPNGSKITRGLGSSKIVCLSDGCCHKIARWGKLHVKDMKNVKTIAAENEQFPRTVSLTETQCSNL